VADFGAERGTAALTRGDGGGIWTAVAARRSDSEAVRLRTQGPVGTVGAFMVWARRQCHPGQPIRARRVAA
jgi:hypothetical protein